MKLIHLLLPFFALLMATVVIIYRVRETKKPISARKILIPPFAMSTGFAMFLYPPTHIPWIWALGAAAAGALFLAPPLIYTSTFRRVDNQIYLQRSRAFIGILLSLFALRFGLHNYVEQHISIPQTAGVFFILAFGMLLPWRIAMYLRYKKISSMRDE